MASSRSSRRRNSLLLPPSGAPLPSWSVASDPNFLFMLARVAPATGRSVRGSLREDAGGYHGGPGVRVLRRERSGLEPSTAELPKPVEIPNVQPDVLLRTDLPNVPGKMLIVVRTTYAPGLHVAPAKSSLHS